MVNLKKLSSKNSTTTTKNSLNSDVVSTDAADSSSYLEKSECLSPLMVPLVGKFARLKYGDNKELIFNINCQIQYLINYFMLKCGEHVESKDKDNIDISDTEGNLKNIRDKHISSKLASELLKPRDTYVLVEIKTTEVKNYFQVVPLLINNELISASFLDRLSPKLPKNAQKQTRAGRNSVTSLTYLNSINNNSTVTVNSSTSSNVTKARKSSNFDLDRDSNSAKKLNQLRRQTLTNETLANQN